MKIERGFISLLILLATGSMSLFSTHTFYSILPLIFGVISVTGYAFKKIFIFDAGIFLTFISYMFASSGMPPNFYNLFELISFFFLLIAIWLYARNTFFVSSIKEARTEKFNTGLSKFRRSSLAEILNTLLIAALLSILGSFIVLYSSLGIEIGSMLEALLMVALSSIVFFITFLIIRLLASQNIRTEDRS